MYVQFLYCSYSCACIINLLFYIPSSISFFPKTKIKAVDSRYKVLLVAKFCAVIILLLCMLMMKLQSHRSWGPGSN